MHSVVKGNVFDDKKSRELQGYVACNLGCGLKKKLSAGPTWP